jgi:pimeloyl-ACP methyl ester carboxylesterase
VTAAGHRLRAQWLGGPRAPDGRALVFLHQGLGSIPQWRGFPAALCQATGLPGLAYERWGFGGSEALVLPRPADHLDVEAERALPEVLGACAIARPVLIGHSDGGTIALLHAAAFPDRVAACITEAAHVFVEDIGRQAIRGVMARWQSGDLRARLAKYHGPNTEAMFRGWAETWLGPEFRDWTMEARLPAITCPTLVIQGAHRPRRLGPGRDLDHPGLRPQPAPGGARGGRRAHGGVHRTGTALSRGASGPFWLAVA